MSVEYTPTPTNHTSAQEYDDGDPPAAAILNPLAEAAFNTAKWAANRVGSYAIVGFDDGVTSSGGTTLATTSDATYGTDPVMLGTVAVQAGDIVEVSVDVHVAIGLSPSTGALKLYYVTGSEAAVDVPGAVNELAEAFSTVKAVHLAGTAHPAVAGNLNVYLDSKVAGGQTMIVEEPIAATIRVMRPNP